MPDKPCPKCREVGRDSSGNHLFLMRDGKTWRCNRCGYMEGGSQYIGKNSIHKDTTNEIKELPIKPSIERKISAETYSHYGVRSSFNEETGEIDARYYPITKDGNVVGYKIRWLPKTFVTTGSCSGKVELFGQVVTPPNGKILVITGGEEDACAAFEMLKSTTSKVVPAVVSLPKGENVNGIADNIDFIKSFEKVILSMDNDEAGKQATEKIVAILGPSTYILTHSEKDISDLRVKGKDKEFINQFWNCKKYKPSTILTVDDVYEKAILMPTHGIPWPWPSLTKATYGIRGGEGTYWGAGVKVGKSEALNEMVVHLISLGHKPFLIKAEEIPSLTVKKLAGKMVGKMFHKPDGSFTQEELIAAINLIKDKFTMFDFHYQGGNNLDTWDQIKTAIRCEVANGCKHVFIDPITCLSDGLAAGDADTFLKTVARELDDIAKKLDFHYFVFCHLNAPKHGPPHEEGGEVKSAQFANSRVMMRSCTYMIGQQRNKKAEDEVERNTTTLVLLEDRMFGNFVKFPIYYNREDGSYKEVSNFDSGF